MSSFTEANTYYKGNAPSENRAILTRRVVANSPERMYKADQNKDGVGAGFNCVRLATCNVRICVPYAQ